MEMNPLILESMWNLKKEEMKKDADFKETYKLYPEFTVLRKNISEKFKR